MRKFVIIAIVCLVPALSGCMACLPRYMAPPEAPVSACYPVGTDPFIPMDHNPSPFQPVRYRRKRREPAVVRTSSVDSLVLLPTAIAKDATANH